MICHLLSKRLAGSQHSLYVWMKTFALSPVDDRDAEIRWLKKDLLRVTEEPHIK